MTRDIIVKEVAVHRERFILSAKRYSSNINEIDNAVQELFLYFYKMNEDTLLKIYNLDGVEGVIRYGCVALRRALTSPRSAYYYQYRKYYNHMNDINTEEEANNISNLPNPEIAEGLTKWELLEKIDKALDSMYWYDADVFRLYYNEGYTLTSLAQKTGISRNSLLTTIDKTRNELKTILNDE